MTIRAEKYLKDAEQYLKDYESEIKQILRIPGKTELKIIESKKKYHVLMVYSKEPYSLLCGDIENIKRFLINVIKANYIRNMNIELQE